MKHKWLVILPVAIVVLAIAQYYYLPGGDRESGIGGVFGWRFRLSGATVAVFSGWLIHWVIQKRSSTALRGSLIGAYLGGYGIYPWTLSLGHYFGLAITLPSFSAAGFF